VSRLRVEDLRLDHGPNGRFYRLTLRGGKTALNPGHQPERIITENDSQPGHCLFSLTKQYLEFLGEHKGSLQPTCSPRDPNKPHAEKTLGYTLALEDLRRTITLAGYLNGIKFHLVVESSMFVL